MDFLVTWRIIFLKYLFERSFLSHLLDVVVEDAEVRGVFLSGSVSPTLFRQLWFYQIERPFYNLRYADTRVNM